MRHGSLALCGSIAALLISHLGASSAFAATNTWEGNASVNWNDLNWIGGNNPPLSGDSLVFGVAGTAGTALNNDLTAGANIFGITFNAGASAYTLTGNSITLGATTPVIANNATGVTQTINLPIVLGGASTFTSVANSTLTFGGAISGAQNLTINGSGTVNLNAANTYSGNTTISAGAPSTGTSVILGTNATLGGTASLIQIGRTTGANNPDTSSLTLSGGNTITANEIDVGFTPGATTASATVGALMTVNGTDTINATTIKVATGNGSNAKGGFGRLNLGAGAVLTLNGASGSGNVDKLSIADYSYLANTTGTALNGAVDFSPGTVTGSFNLIDVGVGYNAGTANTVTAALTFGNGTLSATQVRLGVRTNSGSSTTGTLTLATGTTGTFNVGATGLNMGVGDNANTNGKGVVNVNGGSLNLAGDIANGSTNAVAAVVNLNGGALDMGGKKIGTTANPVTLNLMKGTLKNVDTINTSAGISLNSVGNTLVLDGTNNYTGGTTITAGTLQVGSATSGATTQPLGTGAVTNNGTLIFASGNSASVANAISGSGSVTKNGAGTATLTGALSYSGNTTVSVGTLKLNTALTTSSVTVNSPGTLSGTGALGTFTIAGGTYAPGDGVGTVSVNSLTMPSGTLALQLGATTSDVINVSGIADFTGFSGTGITISLTAAPTLPAYQVLTAGTLTNGASLTLATPSIGRTTFSINNAQLASNIIQIDVGGTAGNLVWKGTDPTLGTTWKADPTIHNWAGTGTGDTTIFIDGDAVTFNDNNNGQYNVSISGTVAPSAVTVSNNSGTYNISGGTISGTTQLSKSGTGILNLGGSHSYTGGTAVSAGTLSLSASNVLSDSGSVVVNGGTFNVGANSDTVATVSLESGSIAGTSGVLTGSSYSVEGGVIAANLGGAAALTKTTGGTVTISSPVSYTGGTTISNGTLALGANDVLADSGSVSVNGGTFDIGGNSDTVGAVTLQSGSIVGTAGTLSASSFGVQSGAVSANLGGAGALTKSTNGTVTLSGSNTYTGATNLSTGTLIVGSSVALPSNTTLAFGTDNTTLDVGAFTPTIGTATFAGVSATTTTQTVTGSGALNVTGNSNLVVGSSASTSIVQLNLSNLASFNFNNAAQGIHVGGQVVVSGTAGATGSLTLGTNNTITALVLGVADTSPASTGGNAQNTGLLHLGETNVLNVGQINLAGGVTNTLNGSTAKSFGTIDFRAGLTAPNVTIRGISGGSSRADLFIGYNSTSAAALNTIGTFDLTTNPGTIDALFGTVIVGNWTTTNGVAGAAGTFKMGNGTVDATSITLGRFETGSGATCVASGTFDLTGGTVSVGSLTLANTVAGSGSSVGTVNLHSGSLLSSVISKGGGAGTATINWDAGMIGNVVGTDLTISGGSSALTINLNGAGAHDVDISLGQTGTITSGAIVAGAGSLNKKGNGSLTLNSANTFTGVTTIETGVLAVGASGSISGTVAIDVNSGATLDVTALAGAFSLASGQTLKGTGTVSGGLTAGVGSTIAPGASPGEINLADTTFAGGTLALEIFGSMAGVGYDRLSVTGTVTLASDSPLTIDLGAYVPPFGETYTIVANDGGDAIAGSGLFTVAGNPLAEGAVFFVDAEPFRISYTGGDGNDVVLSVIPEPSAFVSMIGGLGLLALRRKRNRKAV